MDHGAADVSRSDAGDDAIDETEVSADSCGRDNLPCSKRKKSGKGRSK